MLGRRVLSWPTPTRRALTRSRDAVNDSALVWPGSVASTCMPARVLGSKRCAGSVDCWFGAGPRAAAGSNDAVGASSSQRLNVVGRRARSRDGRAWLADSPSRLRRRVPGPALPTGQLADCTLLARGLVGRACVYSRPRNRRSRTPRWQLHGNRIRGSCATRGPVRVRFHERLRKKKCTPEPLIRANSLTRGCACARLFDLSSTPSAIQTSADVSPRERIHWAHRLGDTSTCVDGLHRAHREFLQHGLNLSSRGCLPFGFRV